MKLNSPGLRVLAFWSRAAQQQAQTISAQHSASGRLLPSQQWSIADNSSMPVLGSGCAFPRSMLTACRAGPGTNLSSPSASLLHPHISEYITGSGSTVAPWWQQVRRFEASKPVIPAGQPKPKKKKADISTYVSVILLKDVARLGKRGAVKLASPGRVRNYLFPAGHVAYATPENVEKYKLKEGEGVTREVSEEYQQRKFNQLLDALTTAELHITRRGAHDQGQPERCISCNVSAKDIVKTAALQLGIGLEPHHLFMDKPIDTAGKYKIPLNLRTAVGQQIELTVIVNTIKNIHHKTRYYA